jgi:hypothetical protein
VQGLGRRRLEVVDLSEDVAGRTDQPLAQRGEAHFVMVPLEQRTAKFAFQQFDLLAQRWGVIRSRVRRTLEVEFLGDGDDFSRVKSSSNTPRPTVRLTESYGTASAVLEECRDRCCAGFRHQGCELTGQADGRRPWCRNRAQGAKSHPTR